MTHPVMKYNPAFLSDTELLDSFVVRQDDFETIMLTVRENTTPSNQHMLLIGPRGSGKTTLVRRVAIEINRDPILQAQWYPLIFAEESYQVTTPGEFWLEATLHLGEQTKDPRWQLKYEEFSAQWQDEETMRERALGQLLAFADEQEKRLLLIVENLNMLLGDQLSDDDAWKLRHTLMNEPRIMLLATATSRFDEIDQADRAMYDLFRTHHLRPLDQDACRNFWNTLTGQYLEGDRVRPIQILTGGNLRLLTILSTFGARMSLQQLMTDLVRLVDEHTEYFKSHLDALAPIERKIYLSLAELWDPSTARNVAQAARTDVNKASSLLRRLVERGAVEILDEPGRAQWYQVTERMYNIYYLFRRHGSSTQRVHAVVRFMIKFYEPEQLVVVAHRIADEVPALAPSQRHDHYQVFSALAHQTDESGVRQKLAEIAGNKLATMEDLPDTIARLINSQPPRAIGQERGIAIESQSKTLKPAAIKAIEEAEQSIKQLKLSEAELSYRRAIEIDPEHAGAWVCFGLFLHEKLERFDEAEAVYKQAIDINPRYFWVWAALGSILHEKLERFDEAEAAYKKAIDINPEYDWAWAVLGLLLHEKLERLDEAEAAYKKAININPQSDWAWAHLGQLLHEKLERFDKAEVAYKKAIDINPEYDWAWARLGQLLHEELEQFDEAEAAYKKAININPQSDWAWAHLGQLLHEELEQFDEAETAYRRVIGINPEYDWAWAQLGQLLHEKLERFDEAEAAYKKAIDINPEYDWAWAQLGQLLHEKLERFGEAEAAYKKAIDINPEFDWAWAHLGLLLHEKLERFDEAETAYKKAIDINPEFDWAWAVLGLLLHEKLERFDEAETAYKKAIDINPEYDWAWAVLGLLLHEKLERFDEAETAYKKAININPEFDWVWAQLGQLLHEELEQFDEAETAYRRVININPQSDWAWAHLGQLLHKKLERFDEAETAYKKAIDINPEFDWAWAQLGQLLHKKLERFDEAETAYKKAIDINPEFDWVWAQLCICIIRKNKNKRSVEETKQHLAKAPETPDLMNSFAWYIYEANKPWMLDYALSYAKKAVTQDSHNGYYHHTLASIQCRIGDMSGALKSASQYVLDTQSVKATVDDAVNLFIELAARGVASQALKLLSESPSAKELEPLIVGMRLFLGENIKVAEEIKEIGLDVAKRICQRADELHS